MGDYVNGPVFNVIAWLTVVSMIILTIVMTIDVAVPGLLMRVFSF
jgi:Mn2+/Fe2+ NRAMP family transporter